MPFIKENRIIWKKIPEILRCIIIIFVYFLQMYNLDSQLGISYVLATGGAMGTALGFNQIVKVN